LYTMHHGGGGDTSPIQKRTRNAIALNRAWRRTDLRRTFAGTSAASSSTHHHRQPQQHQQPDEEQQHHSHIPGAEAIYQEIEAKQLYSEHRTTRQLDAAPPSIDQHLQQLEYQMSAEVPQTVSRGSMQEQGRHRRYRTTQVIQPEEHRPKATHLSKSSYVYRGPYDRSQSRGYTSSQVAYDYQSQERAPVQQLQQQQPIVYREDGSVMTGMSQQELIRKKTRAVRRKKRRFSSKPKKPIVQMPANLLQPVRISAPQQQYYVRTGEASIDQEKPPISRLSSRRNTKSRSPEEEGEMVSSSTTAETTNDNSGESSPQQQISSAKQQQQHTIPQLGTAAAASQGNFTKTLRQPVLAVRGDDALLVDLMERSLGDESFPVLSQTSQLESGEDELWKQTARRTNNVRSSDSRGVRFSEAIDESSVESELPWDQKFDQKVSPASVLDSIQERNKKPKSILRTSRFKPSPAAAVRSNGSDRRVLDFESERLVYSVDRVQGVNEYFGSEPRAMIGGEGLTATRITIVDRRDPPELQSHQKGQLATSREVNSSSPILSGFLDKEGIELSPIRPNRVVEVPVARVHSLPISHVAGHPAEKHLREKMATFRGMRGGVIADRVIEEEQFPDPPLEIDVSPDV
jgi:hypothetical protein